MLLRETLKIDTFDIIRENRSQATKKLHVRPTRSKLFHSHYNPLSKVCRHNQDHRGEPARVKLALRHKFIDTVYFRQLLYYHIAPQKLMDYFFDQFNHDSPDIN